MPMVLHQAVRKQCDPKPPQCLDQDSFERLIVTVIVEKAASSCTSVEDMEHETRVARAPSSWHVDVARQPAFQGDSPLRSVLQK
jgi:hypothetical protein